MSAYYAWNPVLAGTSPPAVESILTVGDAGGMGQGTRAFVQAVLGEMGLEVPLAASSLRAYRCRYYAEFLDEGWRAEWPLVWKLRAELHAIPLRLPRSAFGWFGIERAVDAASVIAPEPRALVVADFADERALRSARQAVRVAARRGELEQLPTFARGEAYGRHPQLHVDLGERDDAFYAGGAVEAVRVQAICEARGGTTHHAHTLARAWL